MQSEQKTVIPVHNPDLKEKLFFFASGLLVGVPFTVVFSQLSDVLLVALPQLGSVAITTPFIEEFGKVFPLFYRHGENERSTITLGILAGLGFGLSAFALDVFSLNAPFVAELPWIFFNAASAGLTAYGIAKRRAVPFFLLSVGLHAANSYLASTTELFYITGPLILFFTLLLAWYLYKRTSPTKIP